MESVIVQEYGAFLGKTSERLVVRGPRPQLELIEGGPQLLLPIDLPGSGPPELRLVVSNPAGAAEGENEAAPPRSRRPTPAKGPVLTEVPFFRISEIVVASAGVSISTDLVEECCRRGIRITFLTPSGKPYAMLSSPMLTATVVTRRKQLAAYQDRRGLEVARFVVTGKLNNQANLLKYFGKYLKETDGETFATLTAIVRELEHARREAERADGEMIDQVRERLLGLEGAAGRRYWEGVKLLMGNRVEFAGREHRGATDPVNAALNYGYGILYSQVWGAVLNAGLEPFAGFLHVDRPGKPSLVLDLIEEFRQPIVDRSVIAYLNKGSRLTMENDLLDQASRRALADKVLERLDSAATFRGKQYKLKSIIQLQARSLALFLRGEGDYKPFSWKW